MVHLLACRRSAQRTAVFRQKGELERRLPSTRCVCLCEPPRLILMLRRRLSIIVVRRSPDAHAHALAHPHARDRFVSSITIMLMTRARFRRNVTYRMRFRLADHEGG